MPVKKYGWAIQDFSFSHIHNNSKMFNISSKYLSFFNNKPPAESCISQGIFLNAIPVQIIVP